MDDGRDDGRDDRDDDRDERGGVSDTLKRLLAAGISGALLTEDVIRGYLKDVKLPKEMLQLFIQGASRQKDEMQQKVTREVSTLLKKIDWVKEVSRFAEQHKFKITAEVEILRKDKSKSD